MCVSVCLFVSLCIVPGCVSACCVLIVCIICQYVVCLFIHMINTIHTELYGDQYTEG